MFSRTPSGTCVGSLVGIPSYVIDNETRPSRGNPPTRRVVRGRRGPHPTSFESRRKPLSRDFTPTPADPTLPGRDVVVSPLNPRLAGSCLPVHHSPFSTSTSYK